MKHNIERLNHLWFLCFSNREFTFWMYVCQKTLYFKICKKERQKPICKKCFFFLTSYLMLNTTRRIIKNKKYLIDDHIMYMWLWRLALIHSCLFINARVLFFQKARVQRASTINPQNPSMTKIYSVDFDYDAELLYKKWIQKIQLF